MRSSSAPTGTDTRPLCQVHLFLSMIRAHALAQVTADKEYEMGA